MGTRGLLGFVIGGRRIGTYNHYDSYPDVLGAAIVKFLFNLTPKDVQILIKHLDEIIWIKEEDVPYIQPAPELLAEYMGKEFHLTPLDKEDKRNEEANMGRLTTSSTGKVEQPRDWYWLLRGMQGAECLPRILMGSLKHLIDATSFQDPAFISCEYVYWIDFDNEEFIMDDGDDRIWKFDKLDNGFWRRSINEDFFDKPNLQKQDQQIQSRINLTSS
ncbi:uncharacterized protein L201_007101 [Kwoniella dendrophila CBS 6074]|uniref:Uncharacterized protein n=1 Tax=Kwoniella dendrophila CBS 6074 TaxID=1295534 RepID=A0AAX4K3G4_9TREE